MNKLLVFMLLFVLSLMSVSSVVAAELPAATLGPDLMVVEDETLWEAKGGSTLSYDSTQQGFPFITNVADGTTNHDTMIKLIQSPYLNLTAGKQYQFVLRMKADTFPQGQTINFKAEAGNIDGIPYEGSRTSTWNVSRAGEWEEVNISVRPQYNKRWYVQVWVNPTTAFARTPSTIYLAPDFDVYELPGGNEAVTLHGVNTVTDKDSFVSRTQLVDGLGNIYTKKETDTVWKHVFPRMIYRDSPTDNLTYQTMFQRYKSYGFTGIMNLTDALSAQVAIDVGLEHLSMIGNSVVNDVPVPFETMWAKIDAIYQWGETTGHHRNLLWYYIDNENGMVGNYTYQESLRINVDTDHLDPQTGKRRHPIYYLNGNVGVPRTYHNASRTAMDLTGSYVGANAACDSFELNPEPSLLTQFMAQNLRAPVSVIQLQMNIGNTFIPSLFYGIIMGGRAMSVWRDGGDQLTINDPNNPWPAAFRDDVSPKIDLMLPIIEQPHFTSWKAWTNQFPSVRIGTRELNGVGYLLLSSFAATDLPVTVTLQNRQATKAVDYFTGAQIATITNGQFTFTMGHYNNGYRVIRLVAPTAAAASPASNDYGTVTNGQTSSSATFTLSNHSSATSSLQINSRTITGTNANQFILSNGSCGTTPFTLAPGGSCTLQVSFKPTATGLKNATLAITSTDVNNPTLSVALSGTGRAQLNLTVSTSNGSGGTVTGDSSGISCTGGNCTYDFTQADTVKLIAAANIASVFGGWSGACTNVSGSCTVTMSSTKTLGAAFNLVPRARIGTTPYGSLISAYAAVPSGGLIQAKSLIFPDSGLSCNRNISFSLKGGYADTYSSQTGYSTISGKLTLAGNGTVTVDRIVIQ
ncbi:hypothetical protein SAMN02745119_00713 [Trichlorobacter thiogenes]|uniref:Cep192/Spd-2-like domain-containing protein n=1 Tax=Trichlorobacter thiogenes TaxID=115783 RepID=A0A1T4L1H4_9BACT|nr:choice-of-anchor D domain-containing protein [Trichlorobacter thiogenes]SJZ48390.1 hypothetical protein SAMN02745119_00713 [Trichlorobacter thiogenes]